MKIWIDDWREPYETDWAICKSVNEAAAVIRKALEDGETIEEVALDHDAGDFYKEGGDFMAIMNLLDEMQLPGLKVLILTSNAYAAETYRSVIRKNSAIGWTEVF